MLALFKTAAATATIYHVTFVSVSFLFYSLSFFIIIIVRRYAFNSLFVMYIWCCSCILLPFAYTIDLHEAMHLWTQWYYDESYIRAMHVV